MRLGSLALAIALFGSACDAQISDGLGLNLAVIDAPIGGPVDPPIDAPPPAPRCASRTVYLNFDGQTLIKGTSDATLNQAGWMQIALGAAPPYLLGKPDRDTTIQSILDGVRLQLAQFPISVVKIRPPSGEYVMIVLGGQQNTVGSLFSGAVNRLDCGDVQHNDVAWVSDTVAPVQAVVNTVIGAIGFGLGLTATSNRNDCMCGWDNTCIPIDTVACTLGSPITRDPATRQPCLGAPAQQDEVATLHDAFCGK
jgi:hypothetical protein